MVNLLAVDPGGKHCGMATFLDSECTDAWELTPADCLEFVRGELISGLDVLIVEKFQLYADRAEAQIGSEMPTVELIGAIKAAWGWWGGNCKLVMQQASIKKPAVQILKAKGIVSVAKRKKAGGHAFDAETHAQWYLQRMLSSQT